MLQLYAPATYSGHGKLPDAQTEKDRCPRPGRQPRNHSPPASCNRRQQTPGWNRWGPAEKAEHLLGLSLDRMLEYPSWPADDLDPYRLAAQTQVIRVVAVVAAKVGGEAARARERQRILSDMTRREFGDDA